MPSDGFETIAGGESGRTYSESKFKKNFEVISRLGKGVTGTVFHVKNKEDDKEYAIKVIEKGFM